MIYTSAMFVLSGLELHSCDSFWVSAVSSLYKKSGRLRRWARYLIFALDIDMTVIDITMESYLCDLCQVSLFSAFFKIPGEFVDWCVNPVFAFYFRLEFWSHFLGIFVFYYLLDENVFYISFVIIYAGVRSSKFPFCLFSYLMISLALNLLTFLVTSPMTYRG